MTTDTTTAPESKITGFEDLTNLFNTLNTSSKTGTTLNTSLNNEATWQERAVQTQQQISEKTSVRLSKVSLHGDEKITPTCD